MTRKDKIAIFAALGAEQERIRMLRDEAYRLNSESGIEFWNNELSELNSAVSALKLEMGWPR